MQSVAHNANEEGLKDPPSFQQKSRGALCTVMQEELIKQAQNGDLPSFQKLVQQSLPNVVALSYKMLGNSAEAEDIAQEVMLSLWQNLDKYDSERGKLSTWLYRITTNRCLDRLRQRKVDQLDENYDMAIEADQDETIFNKQIGTMVDDKLKALPERQYSALILFHYQGHSLQEIAEILECSSEAVESLLARARRAMKKDLKPLWQNLNDLKYQGEL